MASMLRPTSSLGRFPPRPPCPPRRPDPLRSRCVPAARLLSGERCRAALGGTPGAFLAVRGSPALDVLPLRGGRGFPGRAPGCAACCALGTRSSPQGAAGAFLPSRLNFLLTFSSQRCLIRAAVGEVEWCPLALRSLKVTGEQREEGKTECKFPPACVSAYRKLKTSAAGAARSWYDISSGETASRR